MSTKKRKNLALLLKWIFGLFVLIFLFYKVGIKNVYKTLLMLNPFLFLIIILMYTLLFVIGAVNVKILVDCTKKLNFLKILKYYILSWSVGLFVPGRIGEFSIIYFLKKEEIPIGKSSAIAIIDKLTTVITVSALAVVGFFVLPFFTRHEAIKLIILLVIAFSSIIFFIITDIGRKIIKKYVLKKYSEKCAGFSKTFFYYLEDKKLIIFLNTTLTLIKWLIASFITYILFLSFGINLNFFYIILIDAMVIILSLIPLTMSGLGIKESGAVFLYNQIGALPHVTLSVYVVSAFLNYLTALIAYFTFGIKRHSLRD